MPVAVIRPRTVALATAAAVGAVTAYSRVVVPWYSARMTEIRRLNGDNLSVHVDRSGGGI